MSLPDSNLPSRRAVVRAAAWTAPAISIVAAAPAYAVSGGGATAASRGDSRRIDESVRFELSLTNTGLTDLVSPYLVITSTDGSTVDLLPDENSNWTRSGTTWTYNRSIAPNETVVFKPMIITDDGADTQVRTFVATFYDAGSATPLCSLTFYFTEHRQRVTGVPS